MSGVLGSIWPILSSYRPNAARDRRAQKERQPERFGAFEPTYIPPRAGVARPRDDAEAQRMYNHIRTVAYWLDASPLLADLGLPFRAGLDDIISLVPIYGDIISGILQLYQVWLCFMFGVPRAILQWMLFNVILDVIVGIVPIIGDLIDNLFKSNLRNLALLEDWLLTAQEAERYHILIMPDGAEYLPRPKSASSWTSWFGGSGAGADDVRERERRDGRVSKTRRMRKDEGADPAYAASASASGPSSRTRARDRPSTAATGSE